jgi:hypothetical protein
LGRSKSTRIVSFASDHTRARDGRILSRGLDLGLGLSLSCDLGLGLGLDLDLGCVLGFRPFLRSTWGEERE